MAQTEKFQSVFDAHPEAKEIYVVDGMPFLQATDARNYAGKEKQVDKVVRPTAKQKEEDAESADTTKRKSTGKKSGK